MECLIICISLLACIPLNPIQFDENDKKGDSSEWINAMQFVKGKFNLQEGYGAFSYSRSQPAITAIIAR